MKILIAFHDLNDLGGIINNQEDLHQGFTELGHEVEVCKLVWKDKVRSKGESSKKGLLMGKQGMMMDQRGGWIWPKDRIIAYKGVSQMNRWKDYANKFDLIIWQIPVPSRNKSNKGNTDWLELYNVPIYQIAYIHDGHFVKRYPWLYAIKKHLCGVTATHPCGYHSLANIDLPRALSFTAQADQDKRRSPNTYEDRTAGWFSLQTFKGWKRVDELVRAVPYMRNTGPKILAGGGIQWYYMTSKDKVKDDYLINAKKDPDALPHQYGQRIWDVAIDNDLDFRGYVQNSKREQILSSVRFLIDPSWSKNFAAYGDHPNRTSIDAVINGVVPIARDMGIAGPEGGMGEFFKAGESFYMIPWNATPKEFAEHVDEALNMGGNQWISMLEAGREISALWECKRVAQSFIDVLEGNPAGAFAKEGDVGLFRQDIQDASDKAMREFFECI